MAPYQATLPVLTYPSDLSCRLHPELLSSKTNNVSSSSLEGTQLIAYTPTLSITSPEFCQRFLFHSCLTLEDYLDVKTSHPAKFVHHFLSLTTPGVNTLKWGPDFKVHIFYIPTTFDVFVVCEGSVDVPGSNIPSEGDLSSSPSETSSSIDDSSSSTPARILRRAKDAFQREAQAVILALGTGIAFPLGFMSSEVEFLNRLNKLESLTTLKLKPDQAIKDDVEKFVDDQIAPQKPVEPTRGIKRTRLMKTPPLVEDDSSPPAKIKKEEAEVVPDDRAQTFSGSENVKTDDNTGFGTPEQSTSVIRRRSLRLIESSKRSALEKKKMESPESTTPLSTDLAEHVPIKPEKPVPLASADILRRGKVVSMFEFTDPITKFEETVWLLELKFDILNPILTEKMGPLAMDELIEGTAAGQHLRNAQNLQRKDSFETVHRRVEWFLHFFIDAVSNISQDDARWRIYFPIRALSPIPKIKSVPSSDASLSQPIVKWTYVEKEEESKKSKEEDSSSTHVLNQMMNYLKKSGKFDTLPYSGCFGVPSLPVSYNDLELPICDDIGNDLIFEILGLATAYEFFSVPANRMRISQFFIFPNHQRNQIGHNVLLSLYATYKSNPSIKELAVEDPAIAFRQLRDSVAIQLMIESCIIHRNDLFCAQDLLEFGKEPSQISTRTHLPTMTSVQTDDSPSSETKKKSTKDKDKDQRERGQFKKISPDVLDGGHPSLQWHIYSIIIHRELKENPVELTRLKFILSLCRLLPQSILDPASWAQWCLSRQLKVKSEDEQLKRKAGVRKSPPMVVGQPTAQKRRKLDSILAGRVEMKTDKDKDRDRDRDRDRDKDKRSTSRESVPPTIQAATVKAMRSSAPEVLKTIRGVGTVSGTDLTKVKVLPKLQVPKVEKGKKIVEKSDIVPKSDSQHESSSPDEMSSLGSCSTKGSETYMPVGLFEFAKGDLVKELRERVKNQLRKSSLDYYGSLRTLGELQNALWAEWMDTFESYCRVIKKLRKIYSLVD